MLHGQSLGLVEKIANAGSFEYASFLYANDHDFSKGKLDSTSIKLKSYCDSLKMSSTIIDYSLIKLEVLSGGDAAELIKAMSSINQDSISRRLCLDCFSAKHEYQSIMIYLSLIEYDFEKSALLMNQIIDYENTVRHYVKRFLNETRKGKIIKQELLKNWCELSDLAKYQLEIVFID